MHDPPKYDDDDATIFIGCFEMAKRLVVEIWLDLDDMKEYRAK